MPGVLLGFTGEAARSTAPSTMSSGPAWTVCLPIRSATVATLLPRNTSPELAKSRFVAVHCCAAVTRGSRMGRLGLSFASCVRRIASV